MNIAINSILDGKTFMTEERSAHVVQRLPKGIDRDDDVLLIAPPGCNKPVSWTTVTALILAIEVGRWVLEKHDTNADCAMRIAA